jgi:tungstate transport system substrate-binding protein
LADPARVRESRDAGDAFARIAGAAAPFVSRGDLSGTHERENVLWDVAKARPSTERLVTSGRGMAMALRHADELQAYTLTDEATFRQLAPDLDLTVLYEGDPRLRNVYSVIYPPDDEVAARFADWLLTGNGRDLLAAFTIAGRKAFEVISTP